LYSISLDFLRDDPPISKEEETPKEKVKLFFDNERREGEAGSHATDNAPCHAEFSDTATQLDQNGKFLIS
jgi:hypothetical protein